MKNNSKMFGCSCLVQDSLQQQLLNRHDELAKKIVKQQEELKRMASELRMVGLLTPAAAAADRSRLAAAPTGFVAIPTDTPSQTSALQLSYGAFMQDNT